MAPATVVRTPRSADGTRVHAEAVGDPRNPHVVFIHEATLCCSVYDEVFQDARLTDNLYLVSVRHSQHPASCPSNFVSFQFQVRYDLRSHGRSGMTRTPESQHASLHASDFAAVAGVFGLHRPIIVAWYVLHDGALCPVTG